MKDVLSPLEKEEGPIDREMADAIVEASPEWWKAVAMDVEHSQKPGGTEGFKHLIFSPEGHRDLVEPTDRIYATTFRLFDLFKRHGRTWKKVRYTIAMRADGNWDYAAEFNYD